MVSLAQALSGAPQSNAATPRSLVLYRRTAGRLFCSTKRNGALVCDGRGREARRARTAGTVPPASTRDRSHRARPRVADRRHYARIQLLENGYRPHTIEVVKVIASALGVATEVLCAESLDVCMRDGAVAYVIVQGAADENGIVQILRENGVRVPDGSDDETVNRLFLEALNGRRDAGPNRPEPDRVLRELADNLSDRRQPRQRLAPGSRAGSEHRKLGQADGIDERSA